MIQRMNTDFPLYGGDPRLLARESVPYFCVAVNEQCRNGQLRALNFRSSWWEREEGELEARGEQRPDNTYRQVVRMSGCEIHPVPADMPSRIL